jgi:hypothetical protein
MWHSCLQRKMNIISASFGLLANDTVEPLFFLYDPRPEQNNRINNIKYTIILVNKSKLTYTYSLCP